MAELPTGWVLGKATTFKGQPAHGAWLPGDTPRRPKAVVMGVGETPEAAREDAIRRAWVKAGLQ